MYTRVYQASAGRTGPAAMFFYGTPPENTMRARAHTSAHAQWTATLCVRVCARTLDVTGGGGAV